MSRLFSRDQLQWNGNRLCLGNRVLAEIEPDAKWPTMWRVRLPSGGLSDMTNRTRARDAARALALGQLNNMKAAA